MNNIDSESKKTINFVSIDTANVRDMVVKYGITDVPCMVIKEKNNMFVCNYDILLDLFPEQTGAEPHVEPDAPTPGETEVTTENPFVSGQKIDMDMVRREMKEREAESDSRRQEHNVIPDSVKKTSNSILQQYGNKSTTDGIRDFFKFDVTDDRL